MGQEPVTDARNGHLNIVWNTLMFFASESSYTTGERIGGVLQGCPRKPPPTFEEMAGFARRALASLREYVGVEPDAWMLDGNLAPEGWRVIAPDGRVWTSERLLAAVSAAIEQTRLQFPQGNAGVDSPDGAQR